MIKNLINGKVYIGSSIDIYRRWVRHRGDLRHKKHSNKYLQRSFNKYGEENFKLHIVEILKEFNDLVLKQKEQYWIEFYKSYIEQFGYNLSLVPKGIENNETYNKCIEIFRKSQSCRSILQIDLDGKVIKQWDSINQASKILNIKDTKIIGCLKHKRKTYKNFIWIYIEEFNDFNLNNYIDLKYKQTKILQYDLEDNFLKEWNSLKEICDYYNYKSNSNVINCCRGIIYSAYKYKWKYKNPLNKDLVCKDRENKQIVRKTVQLDISNDFICIWNSINKAAKYLKISPSDIGNCARGRQKTAHGFKWMYLEDYEQLQNTVINI